MRCCTIPDVEGEFARLPKLDIARVIFNYVKVDLTTNSAQSPSLLSYPQQKILINLWTLEILSVRANSTMVSFEASTRK